MKKIVSRFLTSALSTFVLSASLNSLEAAFIEATPSTEVTVTGTYSNVYLHGKTSVKVGEYLFPLDLNVTLEPEGAKTKLTLTCGEGEPRYIAGTPGIDRPKLFPAFLESDPNCLLQLDDSALPGDKKKTLHIIATYQGMPLMFALKLNTTKSVAANVNPSLFVTGNGHERFAIATIIPKGGALVAKSSTGQESVLPALDFSSATKADILDFLRKLTLQLPETLAAVSIESKTDSAVTETTFSAKVKS
jgi:hypothetical protein